MMRVEDSENEREFYRQINRRAKKAREHAAETLPLGWADDVAADSRNEK